MGCSIYKKTLFSESKIDSFTIDESFIKGIIPSFDSKYSGIWLPIVIKPDQSKITYTEILHRAESEQSFFDPCNCNSSAIQTDNTETEELDCSYCTTSVGNFYSIPEWSLTDKLTNKSVKVGKADCCQGSCDVRITKDDYLAKLPVLNSSYLTKFYDWKYKKQFPACSNLGLGIEKIAYSTQYNSFTNGPELVIDWRIKERISEIPLNDIDSYHKDVDSHEKSYKRSAITSKTCGNFILTKLGSEYTNNPTYPLFSGIIGDVPITGNYSKLLPSPESFVKPYGFKNQDHYNIFVKTEKVGSYWKWNYTSGILCWYRYFDKDKQNDCRMIPGVDLYISEGDVFYAKNDGPEDSSNNFNTDDPNPNDGAIHSCPSGLKLIKNNSVTGILPNNSEFIYISENIYSKFYTILNKLEDLEVSLDITNNNKMQSLDKLRLAALLSTGPNYHEVTVDLLKTTLDLDDPNKDYTRDSFKQINIFNSGMLLKPQHKLNKLNIVKTKEDLVNTLVDKYGAYIWCPPNSTTNIELKKDYEPHGYIDLDFEPVVKERDTFFSRQCRNTAADCAETTVSKIFAYDQRISVGNLILNTSVDNRYKSEVCVSGVFTVDKSANIISAYFNGNLIKEAYYGSGCTVFYQKYLRAPSYDLAYEKIGNSLCEDYDLCDKRLATIYNKTEGQFDDKSVLLNRRYPANYCNPNIDRIGFNKQGGLYYDSNVFGSGNVVFVPSVSAKDGKYSIKFITKDVGIKLYNLEIFKLRDDNNPECKTFPLNQACKCFPLNRVDGYTHNCNGSLTFSNTNNILYTPNISTQNSPVIKSHGGFSVAEVDVLLGVGNRIQNHPAPNTDLSKVNRIIDPINPYGCSESITVNFPNYVYTKWSVLLPKQYNTSHADVWMKISENVNLFRQYNVFTEDGDYSFVPNPNYRRYTTKAEIKNKVIYGNQQEILFEKDAAASMIDIELTNPFLYELLSQLSTNIEQNKKLYTPLPCSLDVNRNQQDSPFDPYLVQNLGVTFRRLPRKQILAYKFKPLTKIDTLHKTFFHPNSGLITGQNSNETSLLFNSGTCSFDFDYEKKIFGSSAKYSDSGIMFSGIITTGVGRILDSVDNLLNHKKLRLYIKYQNNWYEYLNPNVFGYFNTSNQEVYPGYPLFFEYTKEDKYKTELSLVRCENDTYKMYITKPSPLIPASAKDNIKFTYFHNVRNTGNISILPNNDYPIFNETFTIDKNSNNKIIIPGTRAYFMLEEEDPAEKISTKIADMSEEIQNKIFRSTFVMDSQNLRWRYTGEGPKNDEQSYELVLPRNYKDANFSEGFIDYTNSNRRGYTGNTNVPTKSLDIELVDVRDPKITFKGKIKSKSIFAPKSDKYGNEIPKFNTLKPSEYIKAFTILEFDNICENCEIPIKEGYVKLISPTGSGSYAESFVLFQDFSNTLKLEKEYLLSNKYVQTKWGDLVGFDKKTFADLNNSENISQIIEKNYPTTLYKNILYNITLNNLETGNFKAMIVTTNESGQNIKSGVISYKDPIYYNIHQIYNIGLDRYIENVIEQYQNYLPYIDINFLNGENIKTYNDIYDNLKNNYIKNALSIGDIYISGIRSFVDTKQIKNKPESNSVFFVSLDKNAYLRPVLFNREFYYDTLRVDDVYYRLASLSKEENVDSAGCREVFRPNISFGQKTFNDYFSTSAFSVSPITVQTFRNLPVYCDVDRNNECVNEACEIRTVGYTTLKAGYNHYEYPFITAKVLESQNQIDYSLSVDEGLYNVVGNNSMPYIQRFEIPPKSNLFPDTTLDGTTSCIEGVDDRPNRPQSYIDYEYQTKLTEYILSETNKGDLVKNTDILANEMLFRLIYGSKQKIGYDTIKKKTVEEAIQYKNENSISYLLQYSNPRTTPDSIYKLIPYDYSNQSDTSKRKIQGSIYINGVLRIGKNVSVKIGDANLSIVIQKIDGKIYSIATCNGITASGMIHDEDQIEYGILSVQGNGPAPSPSGPNQTIKLLQTCDIPDSYSWSKGRYFTAMSYNNGEKEVDVVGEYLKCMRRMSVERTCVNRIDWGGDPPDGSVLSGGLVDCVGSPPCVGCYSRGYAPGPGQWIAFGQAKDTDVPNFGTNGGAAKEGSLEVFNAMPPNCSVITTRSADVTVGGLGRGSFGTGGVFTDCAVRQNPSISTSPCQLGGDFDMVMGGLAVMNLFPHRNCKQKEASCKGICTTLDFEDKHGKVNTPVRYRTGPDGSAGGPICECSTYNFGYCGIPDSTCGCQEYYAGFPKIFKYEFEYCNYKFTNMRGHLWKYEDGESPVWGGQTINISCVPDPLLYESLEYDASNAGKATEECYWAECVFPSQNYRIYESKTINPNPYKPLCPTNLCTINYDNNVITLTLSTSVTCFSNTIRSNCPEISITLPDSTFTFSDSINSECTECEVAQNAIKEPITQHPEWDIITETRTAILDWTLPIEGDRNIDAIGGGGAVYVDKSICGDTQPCCCDNCYAGTGGFMQCGRSAPASWVWWHGLACNLNGSPGPSFFPCKKRVGQIGMTNLRTGIGFYIGSDNGAVKSRVIADWRNQVRAIYRTYAPCFNNRGSINVDDLIEGVIPGSCSELQFATASYPIVAWRKTLGGGESSEGSLGIHYAYFTYQYKRPRTIQDVFLGDNASKCSTVLPIFPTQGYNITEKYEIKNCQTIPTCSDTKPEVCNTENECCRYGRSQDRKDI